MLTAILSAAQLDRAMTWHANSNFYSNEHVPWQCVSIVRDANSENTNLVFIFKPYLLLYKRDLPPETVVRLWYSFFAAERPNSSAVTSQQQS